MKWIVPVLLASALPLPAAKKAGESLPPLPEWREEDRKALLAGELTPGALLFFMEEEVLTESVPPEMQPPSPEEIATPEADANEVPERFLESYFGQRPEGFLVDPQGLLDAKATKDRSGFLRYHSADSGIDLYVYLLEGGQDIPAGVRHDELAERFFSEGKPAVLVFYFLGAPQRSLIQMSPDLGDAVTTAERQRALASSVAEALQKADGLQQFEAFCVQMSIRLYWMERAAGLVSEPAALEAGSPERTAAAAPEPSAFKERAMAVARQWAGPAALAFGGAALAGAGLWSLRARRRFRFPEFDVAPRLGGAHGAGIGAVISFGSTSQSPASQRSEVPDYLAGI